MEPTLHQGAPDHDIDPADRGETLRAAWRRLAAKALDGAAAESLENHTPDGILVEPYYPAARGDRPLRMRATGRAWRVVQRSDDPDIDRALGQVRRDLKAGADTISLAFAGAASAGGFGLASDAGSVRRLIAPALQRGAGIRIEPHPRARQTALEVAGTIPDPVGTDISFGLDFVGNMARWGGLPVAWPEIAGRFASTVGELASAGFAGPFAEADGRPFHNAGATDAQELAAMLAAAAVYLRALDRAGTGPDPFATIGLSLSVDCDQLCGIAKLRAARLLWSHLQDAVGAPRALCRIHADTSRRMMTALDPHTNILRTAIAAFAAGVGGADSVCVAPFSAAAGLPDAAPRRLAANIQHLLIEEAHVAEIADPAAGSGAIAALTDALAARAWEYFQEIEREGGIVASLAAGALQERIAASAHAWRKGIKDGSTLLVGLTAFRADAPSAVPVLPAEPAPEPILTETACKPLLPLEFPEQCVQETLAP